MGREVWQAMSVYFIPPTGNFEICIDEAMGGKDGLEAQLQPKWAGSLSRSYITKAFSRVPGDVAGSPGCAHTGLWFYATRVQQKALGKWSGKGLLQSLRAHERVRSELWNDGWGCSQGPGGTYWWTGSGLEKMPSLRFALTQLRHWTSFGSVWWVPGLTGLLDMFYTASGRKAKLVSGSCISYLATVTTGSQKTKQLRSDLKVVVLGIGF